MAFSSLVIYGVLSPSFPPLYFSKPSSVSSGGWRLPSKESISTVVRGSNTHTLRVLANSNTSSGKRVSKVDVVMVDPLEAKRLAAKQMQDIRAREKIERQRQIEAINGAWAMIGLTAGLVIEGQTGKTILNQVIGYLTAIIGFFWR